LLFYSWNFDNAVPGGPHPFKAINEKNMKIIIKPKMPRSQFVNIGGLDCGGEGWYTFGNEWRRG
jgi:hypothetical protein